MFPSFVFWLLPPVFRQCSVVSDNLCEACWLLTLEGLPQYIGVHVHSTAYIVLTRMYVWELEYITWVARGSVTTWTVHAVATYTYTRAADWACRRAGPGRAALGARWLWLTVCEDHLLGSFTHGPVFVMLRWRGEFLSCCVNCPVKRHGGQSKRAGRPLWPWKIRIFAGHHGHHR